MLDEHGVLLDLFALPILPGLQELDARQLAERLRPHADFVCAAAVERVGARPGQGVCSMFSFGLNTGAALGALRAMGIEPKRPTPQAWKKRILGEAYPHDKDGAVAWCAAHYPGAKLVPPRGRVPHDGMADALCLARWAWEDATSDKP